MLPPQYEKQRSESLQKVEVRKIKPTNEGDAQ